MKKITLLCMFLMCLFSYSQIAVGDTFTENTINYKVTNLSPLEVAVGQNRTATGVVTIPETVEEGGNTFSVTSVENAAFEGTQITSIVIPNTVTSIGTTVFKSATLLASAQLSENLTKLGAGLFENTSSLKSLTVPEGVTTIDFFAFRNSGLESIVFPSTLTGIPSSIFSGNVTMNITVQNTIPISISSSSFSGVNLASSTLIVPKSTLDAYKATPVWRDFGTIREFVEIGETFTKNGINYKVTNLSPFEVAVGQNRAATGVVTIPETVEEGGTTFSVVSIENAAYERSQITEITIPNSVTVIGTTVFKNTTLSKIELSNNLTTISAGLFDGTSSLKNLTIPEGITIIERLAFIKSGLEKISFPSTLTTIGSSIFSGTPVKEITVHNSTPIAIDANALGINFPTTTLIVTKGTKTAYEAATIWKDFGTIREIAEIGDTFVSNGINYTVTKLDPLEVAVGQNRTAIGVVTIPEIVEQGGATFSVTSVENAAFEGSQITSIVIPNTVTSIGTTVFKSASLLASAQLSENLTKLGAGLFENASSLKSLTVPEGVETIDFFAFRNSGLESIVFPSTLTGIPSSIFSGNVTMNVTVKNTSPISISSSSFSGVNLALSTLIVPTGTLDAYKVAIVWRDFGTITENTLSVEKYENALDIKIVIQESVLKIIDDTIQIERLQVYNLLGTEIISGNGAILNLETLQNGVYILKILTENGRIVTRKFVKY